MNPNLINNIRKAIVSTDLKKNLEEYFTGKDMNLDLLIYPPVIMDMPESIQGIGRNIELIPFMEELDPTSGNIKLGWNFFIFGTNRRFLGYTTHESISDLNHVIDDSEAAKTSLRYMTPSDLIVFIMDCVNNLKDDFLPMGDMKYSQPQVGAAKLPVSTKYNPFN